MPDAQTIWRSKSDEELLEAAAVIEEYTDEGQAIIRAELKRRRLNEPAALIGVCAGCGTAIVEQVDGNECPNCGTPYPPEILRALGAVGPKATAIAELPAATTPTGEPMTIAWEAVRSEPADLSIRRARVPGGWLVANDVGSLTFLPDPTHRWNGQE